MVTRTIPIEGAKGSKELVVGDLPEQVVADSFFAEGGGGIEVRAVQFRSRAVGEEPRNEVRKVDEGIEQVNDKLLENTKAQERLTKQTAFLDQLDGQGHRIKIGGLGRMANSAFGGKLNLCGTCSHLFTMFVVYLVVDNKYNVYVR